MTVQSTYRENLRTGLPGQISNTIPATIVSRTIENSAGVAFGAPVAHGAADKSCKATEAGDTTILGPLVRERCDRFYAVNSPLQ